MQTITGNRKGNKQSRERIRKRWKLLLFICVIHTTIGAQVHDADSLLNVIAQQEDDSNKVNNLLHLSRSFLNSDPIKGIQYAEEAMRLAEKVQFPSGRANALKNIGLGHYTQGNYSQSIDLWNQSLQVFTRINDEVGIANMLNNLGAISYNQGDDAKALEYYLESLRVAEKTNNSLRIATALNNIGAVYFNKVATHKKALGYYLKALPLSEQLQDQDAIGTTSLNIGEIYLAQSDLDSAMYYFRKSLVAYDNSENKPSSLNGIGKVYAKKNDYANAISYHRQAYRLSKNLNAQLDMAYSLLGIADTYQGQGNLDEAITNYLAAERIAKNIQGNYILKAVYEGLASTYAKDDNFGNAYRYQTLLNTVKDTLYNKETAEKLAALAFDFEIEKKQGQIDLLTKSQELQELELRREKLARNSLIAGLVLIFVIAFIILRNNQIKSNTNRLLDRQKAEIEKLVLNILPAEVARELQRDGYATPRYYESVSVLFSDFQNFTQLADGVSPQHIVAELNECFMAFDDIIERYNLEKIKTIGDAYMCAGGIPVSNDLHQFNIVKASLEINSFIRKRNEKRMAKGLPAWELRIGIHTGPVVAGVVGRKKYAYDIWGSTVNIANRMESNGEPGQVNISASTYELIKDRYACRYRGKIHAKNVGEIDMYFVEREIS